MAMGFAGLTGLFGAHGGVCKFAIVIPENGFRCRFAFVAAEVINFKKWQLRLPYCCKKYMRNIFSRTTLNYEGLP
jgi:hypothetical protein